MGKTELLTILFLALLLFGGKKLPELARSMGEAMREFNEASKEPVKYIDEKTRKSYEKQVIINAAEKMGISVEGRDIKDIAQDIVKATQKIDPA